MSTTRTAPPENGTAPALQPALDGAQLDTSEVGRAHVREIQRTRMIAAITDVVAERGVSNMTVAHIVLRAGVSRRTFYEIFEDCQDCFLAAFDEALVYAGACVLGSLREQEQGSWRKRTRAALTALLGLFEREPATGRLLLVETLAAGPRALERRRGVVERLAAAVDEGRSEGKATSRATPLTAEGVVGAVLAVLHGRLLEQTSRGSTEHQSGGLLGLLNPLMEMIVLPYLGPAAARRELDMPVPKVVAAPRVANSDPLRELEMRLTYRTVRVLTAVAANAGSSNRGVADAAGIADQGQISKLLARLHGLGLIDNTVAGRVRGEPNAWALTEKGREVHGVVALQNITN